MAYLNYTQTLHIIVRASDQSVVVKMVDKYAVTWLAFLLSGLSVAAIARTITGRHGHEVSCWRLTPVLGDQHVGVLCPGWPNGQVFVCLRQLKVRQLQDVFAIVWAMLLCN